MIVYMAGPLFTLAEQLFNRELSEELRKLGFDISLPQGFCANIKTTANIYKACITCLNEADAVIVNCDGPDIDSGTAFEAGYAHALEIPIGGYRTDFRQGGDSIEDMNLMLSESAAFIVNGGSSVSELANKIAYRLRDL